MEANSQRNSVGLSLVHLSQEKKEELVHSTKSKSNHVSISLSGSILLLKVTQTMSSNSTADSPSASSDSGSNFFQEIFISFVALSSLFIGLCLVRWLVQRNATRHSSLPEKSSTGGLDSAAKAALPTFPYRKCGSDNKSDEENIGSSMECSICLSAVEEGEIVKVLPECMHSFHGDCVDLWLGGHTTCPVCRIQVLGSMSTASQPSQAEMVPSLVLNLEGQP